MTAVKYERPPNFDRILAAFPDADKPGVMFAYGSYIYKPDGGFIPLALHHHEAVHIHRQLRVDMTPDRWWELYIADPEFRYNEELLAHVAEYKVQLPGLDRNTKAKLLQATALRLTAKLYNYQPPRTLAQAMRDLRQELQR